MKKTIIIFFLWGSSAIFSNNLVIIPIVDQGTNEVDVPVNIVRINEKDEINFLTQPPVRVHSVGGSSKGGILSYSDNSLSINYYNAYTSRQVIGRSPSNPLLPISNGKLYQNVSDFTIEKIFSTSKDMVDIALYSNFDAVSGGISLYNLRLEPYGFRYGKGYRLQTLFPQYDLTFKQRNDELQIGAKFNFTKFDITFYAGNHWEKTVGFIKGNSFFKNKEDISEMDLVLLSTFSDVDSYIDHHYKNMDQYELTKNFPSLSRKTKSSKLIAATKLSFSLIRIFFPQSSIIDLSSLRIDKKEGSSYSVYQNTSLFFHKNFGVYLGVDYSQTGTDDRDLSIRRRYEVGPLFRYIF